MKTLVGVNVLNDVSSFVYASHCKLWKTIQKDYPDDEFMFYTPQRQSIDMMRNNAAKMAIENNCDYLMFIDDDVIVQPNTYKSLREADKDIIMALTYIRGYPFHPMCFREFDIVTLDDGKIRRNLTMHGEEFWEMEDNGLFKTGAVGFSCVLIKVDVLRALNPPYFVTGPGHTEDVYFCLRVASELEPCPSIYVDTKCPTGHILTPDVVSKDNVEILRIIHKPLDEPTDSARARKLEYLREVMAERELNVEN